MVRSWEELPNGLTEWKSIETATSIQITAKVHVVAVEDQEDALIIWERLVKIIESPCKSMVKAKERGNSWWIETLWLDMIS